MTIRNKYGLEYEATLDSIEDMLFMLSEVAKKQYPEKMDAISKALNTGEDSLRQFANIVMPIK